MKLFPTILDSALRADKNLQWQLAALDTLSIWLLRATRSPDPSYITSHIASSVWEAVISLCWIRWASAPNSNTIQKTLKEIFSKALVLQRILFTDWERREVDLLKHVVGIKDMDLKVQCYLVEVLVRRAVNGAGLVMELQPDWVIDKLGQMKDGGVGPAVGKCLVSVLMVRRTELMTEDSEVLSTFYQY
jgi:hypothetical protein